MLSICTEVMLPLKILDFFITFSYYYYYELISDDMANCPCKTIVFFIYLYDK